MSETASSTHPAMEPAAGPAPRGSTETFHALAPAESLPPLSDDQPTVITHRPPLSPTAEHSPSPFASNGSAPISMEPGSRLDHFELIEYIGGGGMGRVYRARDLGLGREVALKILSREQARDPDVVARFLNEARSVARLNHEGVAQVHYVGEVSGLPFIAFEFVDGVDVRALTEQQGPLGLADAVSFTLQVAEALAHAAERRVVHRDVKPSNVLITPDGRAKLIDFGLARLRDPDDPSGDLTASGVTLGTFDYISPEQARDPRNADQRSDIYSLGCTFFFMLAGRPPYPEGTVLQKLLRHQGDEPPDIRQFRPEVPDDIARVLRKMMAKDPRRRYHDLSRLIDALAGLVDLVGLHPLGPGRRIWAVPQDPAFGFLQRHASWIVPFAVLLAIAVLLDGFWPSQAAWPDAYRQWDQARAALSARPPEASSDEPVSATGDASTPAGAPAAVADDAQAGARTNTAALEQNSASPPAAAATAEAGKGTAAVTAPAGVTPPPAPAIAEQASAARVLVVDPNSSGDGVFTSLQAATAVARSGDIIELRYDERHDEPPLAIGQAELVIRAAENHRPVLVFAGGAGASMIVDGGSVTITGLALEWNRTETSAGGGSLFQLRNAPRLRLQQCWLTVRDAAERRLEGSPRGMFLDVVPPADPSLAGSRRTAIELDDCIARGEADFLTASGSAFWNLTWNNGLLATSERLVAIRGAPVAGVVGDGNEVSLDHLMVSARSGLCLMEAAEGATGLRPVSFRSTAGIFIASEAALVEQTMPAGGSLAGELITWEGESNFFEGFSYFRILRDANSGDAIEEVPLGMWSSSAGAEAEAVAVNQLRWRRLPDSSRAAHTHVPNDYLLDRSAPLNPAINIDGQGGDAGMVAERLPAPPLEPVAYMPYTGPSWR